MANNVNPRSIAADISIMSMQQDVKTHELDFSKGSSGILTFEVIGLQACEAAAEVGRGSRQCRLSDQDT